MCKLYATGYGGTETLPGANNTRTRATTVQGHTGTVALRSRAKGLWEHGEAREKECDYPFNTVVALIEYWFMLVLWSQILFHVDVQVA